MSLQEGMDLNTILVQFCCLSVILESIISKIFSSTTRNHYNRFFLKRGIALFYSYLNSQQFCMHRFLIEINSV